MKLKQWVAPFGLVAMAVTLTVGMAILGFIVGLVSEALGKPRWFDTVVGPIYLVGAITILFAAMRATSREFYDDEGGARPRVRDHVRHTALLYLVAIGLVAWAVITLPMDMFGVTVFFPFASMIGIIADYSVWRSRCRTLVDSALENIKEVLRWGSPGTSHRSMWQRCLWQELQAFAALSATMLSPRCPAFTLGTPPSAPR